MEEANFTNKEVPMSRYPMHFDGAVGLLEDDYRSQVYQERREADPEEEPAPKEKEEEEK